MRRLSIESLLSYTPRHKSRHFYPHAEAGGLILRFPNHASKHLSWRKKAERDFPLTFGKPCDLALRTREYLRQNIHQDINLESLALELGTDRFRLTRRFKAAFGLAPHAYLIQLRLAKARTLLSQGISPISVASDLCFADQSHLGRWFRRAYRLTPSAYQKQIFKAHI